MKRDIVWIRVMLNTAEAIPSHMFIDSKRVAQPDEIVLGEVGKETRQLYTLIQRFAHNREKLMEQVGKLMRDASAEAQEQKQEKFAWAREVTWNIELLKVILRQHLQMTFHKKPDAWIEIRKGFLAVIAKPSKRSVLRLVKDMWK